ncbi:hypothetical protein CGG80_22440 [Vibrio parahaemolyticus]|uniref:hypothetical protein n=1 Tax=Vibrio parahaemolyticus TaxID=670 RepID=UPI001121AA70|nr:hypothetical protein [Vibrio parahaemolyticus]MDG2757467.1 hypothetical protein [Vibrio parahaemolyticus]TOQ05039.1 hypothetical protein CGH03_14535 [Vibrio parahaemolyticus]TOR12351.1 hypothetical protein CGG80_22440 [Vibrio parahaemolyticus]
MRLSHKRKIAHKKGTYQPRLVNRIKFRWPLLQPGEKVSLFARARTGLSHVLLDETIDAAMFPNKPPKVVMSFNAKDCIKKISLAAKRVKEFLSPKNVVSS